MSRAGTMEPLKKYDEAFGQQYRASTWEYNNSMPYAGTEWAGHCNGLSAAGIMAREPVREVNYNGVQFSVEDVKALLVEAWQGSGSIVGEKCDVGASYDSFGRALQRGCRDLNPGAMHVAVTNYLGNFYKGLIMDFDGGIAVWNFPVYGFKVAYRKDMSPSEAMRWITGSWGPYTFNTGVANVAYIQMELYVTGHGTYTYEYMLELDSQGTIIGGEWQGQSKSSHPDFMWRPESPQLENPYMTQENINAIVSRSY